MQLSRAKPGNTASYLYRRGNVILLKLGIGSIWETGFYIERDATHIEQAVQYKKLGVQYRNQG